MPLIRTSPVAIMAAPHHFERAGNARYPGEWSMNPNPACMFLAIRQWCADHTDTVRMLHEALGLTATAIVGYSFGAFQSLLLAAGGGLDLPIVSISSTNRYAYGLRHGLLGRELLEDTYRVGIDATRFDLLVDPLRLERYAHRVGGDRVLYIRGIHDRVDPPPSLERLEKALAPARSIRLDVGHATIVFRRDRVFAETIRFLREHDAVHDPGVVTRRPASRHFS
jgi:pimeloyl-ACP methyl ester carboxylesterase